MASARARRLRVDRRPGAARTPAQRTAGLLRTGSGAGPRRSGSSASPWLELVYLNRDAPNVLAFLSLAYAAVQLVGMSLYGIETCSERADAF